MTDTILVVDDEPDVVDLLVFQLKKAGFKPITAGDGISALNKAREKAPSLIILDLMLPGMDGCEVCRQLKADGRTRPIPIIMLTAKAEETDRIVGLELGADDYVVKPFSPREVVLRVKAILGRGKGEIKTVEQLKEGDLSVDLAKHEVLVKGRAVNLTITEFRLLVALMERRSRVQSREQLLGEIWGYEGDMETRTVDTHIQRLREKLGPCAGLIQTVRGVGYRFVE
jgi:two-component system phosphate regulon response regulator PhoB